MGRPRKDEPGKAAYHTKAKAWLVCGTCDRSIPYQGKDDPNAGDGWPLHRCSNGKPGQFTRYTTTDPHPPPPLPAWDDYDKPKISPEIIIG